MLGTPRDKQSDSVKLEGEPHRLALLSSSGHVLGIGAWAEEALAVNCDQGHANLAKPAGNDLHGSSNHRTETYFDLNAFSFAAQY